MKKDKINELHSQIHKNDSSTENNVNII